MQELTAGYRALREGAAWLDLTGRGVIRVTGEDRARLLHAMTTNKIQGMEPGEWRYAFFLSAQGRMLSDVNILCTASELILDVEPESRAFVLEHLDKFIIADDVELADVSDDTAVIALEGPNAVGIAAATGDVSWPVSSTGAEGRRFFVPIAEKVGLIARLEAAGAVAASPQDAEAVRLEHARPRYGADLTAAHIPHEARLAGAVHFSKGCYIGQEIIERVRSRGRPNRLLTHFEVASTAAIPPGSKLLAHEGEEGDLGMLLQERIKRGKRDVGEITSSAYSPAEKRVVALGYVRAEFSDPGKQVTVETATGSYEATATSRLVETPAK